ncbi:flavodoxin [Leptotrichia sp. OH3620_COT-345]|uniref:flavodoxin family protein n=1 Tax=Leptotrichia sp. OH3620_COT-345 TaxID=2491048 RepID=UPI000F64FA80|nr:flavodoxin family protein [Leptotrichia sp. OH3620_COT-345]RRD40414.1 flavodoxin [Leptotrichia sp. OH3620_COT-345]
MSTLVIYSTLTGNTRKIAEAIYEVISGEKKIADVKDIINIDKLEKYDKIIFGYWVDKGDADERIKKIMEKVKNKTVGAFGTLGAEPESEHAKKCMEKVKEFLEKNGNKVEREFICRGAIDPKLLDKFRKIGMSGHHASTPENERRWAEAAKHPDENDCENAKKIFKGF